MFTLPASSKIKNQLRLSYIMNSQGVYNGVIQPVAWYCHCWQHFVVRTDYAIG